MAGVLSYVTLALAFLVALIVVVGLAILFASEIGKALNFLFATGATVFFEYSALVAAFVLLLFPPFPPYVYLSNIIALLLLLQSFWLTTINTGLAWIAGPNGTRPPFLVLWHVFASGIVLGVAAVQFEQYLLGAAAAAFLGVSFGLASAAWPYPLAPAPCTFAFWFRGFRTFLLPSLLVLAFYAWALYVYRERVQPLDLGFVALNLYLFVAILVAFTLSQNLGKFRLANQAIFFLTFAITALAGQTDLAVFTLLAWINYFVIAFLLFSFGKVAGVFLAIVSIVITGAIYALLLP